MDFMAPHSECSVLSSETGLANPERGASLTVPAAGWAHMHGSSSGLHVLRVACYRGCASGERWVSPSVACYEEQTRSNGEQSLTEGFILADCIEELAQTNCAL